jgi:hypothetical protein
MQGDKATLMASAHSAEAEYTFMQKAASRPGCSSAPPSTSRKTSGTAAEAPISMVVSSVWRMVTKMTGLSGKLSLSDSYAPAAVAIASNWMTLNTTHESTSTI